MLDFCLINTKTFYLAWLSLIFFRNCLRSDIQFGRHPHSSPHGRREPFLQTRLPSLAPHGRKPFLQTHIAPACPAWEKEAFPSNLPCLAHPAWEKEVERNHPSFESGPLLHVPWNLPASNFAGPQHIRPLSARYHSLPSPPHTHTLQHKDKDAETPYT
jgi:hypothetical protein